MKLANLDPENHANQDMTLLSPNRLFHPNNSEIARETLMSVPNSKYILELKCLCQNLPRRFLFLALLRSDRHWRKANWWCHCIVPAEIVSTKWPEVLYNSPEFEVIHLYRSLLGWEEIQCDMACSSHKNLNFSAFGWWNKAPRAEIKENNDQISNSSWSSCECRSFSSLNRWRVFQWNLCCLVCDQEYSRHPKQIAYLDHVFDTKYLLWFDWSFLWWIY